MSKEKFNLLLKLKRMKRPATSQLIAWSIALIIGILLLIFTRNFIACWRITSLSGIPLPSCPNSGNIDPQGTRGATALSTISAPQVELPPPWDGASRVTVLVIGLDYRDWETGQGAPRSDTMMLLTIDPISRTAGMLSIPRDLWVNIPGYGYSKINVAYSYGAGASLPGGGPGLSMKTVEALLGVSIQYFVRVDFSTFERFIDTIGGIFVDVPAEITVDPIGPHNTVTLKPGYQSLEGAVALAYARARHTEGGDIDRAQRQQQVLMAIREKIFSPRLFPTLIVRAPELYQELSSGIDTNMTLEDALRLAVFVQDIPSENISRGIIDYSMLTLDTIVVNGENWDIFKPVPDRIRELRDEIFTPGGALSPMAVGDETQLMQAEAASVIVVNGSYVSGLATKTNDYLISQGMNVIAFGNQPDYPDKYLTPFPERTIIIVHDGKPYAIRYLWDLMGFNTNMQIIVDFDPNAPADILLALGNDWANNNPMP